eukprot:Plantae.Rhodophyta-Purpureofilum_apyrenoidigerum.ctg10738.p1 GENE.Plantae.Rhodophyta-Purpureofilum_apyrenoidigerum.ctg10738~~Plantae.Rhodophyta-Purpureofilum_apyrenoidigerum.ctg10738.p1  ORF type:complete len:397 (+),score=75.82 Plantae.Rhodophyta-Purpureofilum_apyrenoidigerum.ctg10738:301-1491(+)
MFSEKQGWWGAGQESDTDTLGLGHRNVLSNKPEGLRRLGVVALLRAPVGEHESSDDGSKRTRYGLSVAPASDLWRLAVQEFGHELVVEVPLSSEDMQLEDQFHIMFSATGLEQTVMIRGTLVVLDAITEDHLAGPLEFSLLGSGEKLVCTMVVNEDAVYLQEEGRHLPTVRTTDVPQARLASDNAQPRSPPFQSESGLTSSGLQHAVDPDLIQPAEDIEEILELKEDAGGDVGAEDVDVCDKYLRKSVQWNADESFSQLLLSVENEEASKGLVKQKLTSLCDKFKKTKKTTSAKIDVNDLSPFFGLTREELSKMTGICLTLTKRVIRQVGITRWPCRKYRQWQRRLESAVKRHKNRKSRKSRKSAEKAAEEKEKYDKQIAKLKDKYVADVSALLNN